MLRQLLDRLAICPRHGTQCNRGELDGRRGPVQGRAQPRPFLLIGDDNLAGLPSWRGFEDLRHMVTFIVLQRAFTPVAHEYLSVDRRIDISATEIRNRIASGRSIQYLVPRSVEQIIRTRGLYREVAK